MARTFTSPQMDVLTADAVKVVTLLTFWLDSGTYRFCDDTYDISDGVNTWIGASAFTAATTVTSGTGRASEGLTLTVDSTKVVAPEGVDPAVVLRSIMDQEYHQRRVDIAIGWAPIGQKLLSFSIPIYAGLINNCKLTHEASQNAVSSSNSAGSNLGARLEIALDSLAARYGRSTQRTRSHADQQQIDSTDQFFSFVVDVINNEKTLYWGGQGGNTAGYGLGGGGTGGRGWVGGGGTLPF